MELSCVTAGRLWIHRRRWLAEFCNPFVTWSNAGFSGRGRAKG